MGVLDSLDALDAPSTAVPADELRQVKTLLWDIVRVNVAPAEVDEVKRFLGTAAVDDNAQLMDEASALATIVGEVRRDVDDGATARRLYENPARALVEGELRLLVKSIRRTASGDSAEGSGRPPSGRPRSLAARRETEEPADAAADLEVSAAGGGAKLARDATRSEHAVHAVLRRVLGWFLHHVLVPETAVDRRRRRQQLLGAANLVERVEQQ
jgi:hypothetical protein